MALPQSQISLTFWALCIDPPFAKLIRGSWFAKVVVMAERSTEQNRQPVRLAPSLHQFAARLLR
jgi:hypothetical protein